MSTPAPRTLTQFAAAVVASCADRGHRVDTHTARVAAHDVLGPIADRAGITIETAIAQYGTRDLVERVAAALTPTHAADADGDLDSPPMPAPGAGRLADLVTTTRDTLTNSGVDPQAASAAAMMASVYGWMEGHIEGEDYCPGGHAPHPVPHPAWQPAELTGLADRIGTDPATWMPPGAAPWPDPDSQALALVVTNALDPVPAVDRSHALATLTAAAALAWAAGHDEGHRCPGCTFRGSPGHARENTVVRTHGGGRTQLADLAAGRTPGFVTPGTRPLARHTAPPSS